MIRILNTNFESSVSFLIMNDGQREFPGKSIDRKVESHPLMPPKENKYRELIEAIDHDPHSESVWVDIGTLARLEEKAAEQKGGFYSHVSLGDLIAVGEQLRSASTMEEKYRVLAGRSTTGELWHDIILGHVNDKNLPPLIQAVSARKRWKDALDIGSGTGNSLRAISPYCLTITGIDELDFLLEISKNDRQFPRNARLIVGNAVDLGSMFRLKSFDLAVSNGLTHYLTKEEMQKFISGLAGILCQDGSYFEPYAIKEPEDLLPAAEREYLSSAKGVFTCLLDRLVSDVDKPSEMDFNTMIRTFKTYAFEVIPHQRNEDGIFVMQFRKMRNIPVR